MIEDTILNCWEVTLDPSITNTDFNSHLRLVCDSQHALSAHHVSATIPTGATTTPTETESVAPAVPNPNPYIIRHVFNVPDYKGYSGIFDDEMVTRIRTLPFVQDVLPVHVVSRDVVQAEATPNCWGLGAISHVAGSHNDYLFEQNAPAGGDIYVYVVDDPVLATHNEFQVAGVTRVIHEQNILGPRRAPFMAPNNLNGHGTHVAGIIAGRTCGVARFVKIISVKVFQPGVQTGNDDIRAALLWIMADAPARTTVNRCVVNMSLSSPLDNLLNARVDAASAAGLLIIATAGNRNQPGNRSPGSAASAIAVAAAMIALPVVVGQPILAREPHSNYGVNVNIFAPGHNIRSSRNNGDYVNWTGTSMAAPFVAGVAAYLIAHNAGLNTPALLRARILDTATAGLIRNPLLATRNRFLYNGSGQ